MKVQPVNQQNVNQKIAKTALTVGCVSSAMNLFENRHLLAASISNTLKGKDKFVSQAKEAAVKTMKETGKNFDLEQIAKNASEMYSVFPQNIKNIAKSSGKVFITAVSIIGAGLVVGNFLGDLVLSPFFKNKSVEKSSNNQIEN